MKKTYEDKMIVQEWMTGALIELIKDYKYEDITITMIAEKAGVSRMTYYRNYTSKIDILFSYSHYFTELFSKELKEHRYDLHKHFWYYVFKFIKDNANYFLTLVHLGKAEIVLDVTNKNIKEAYPNELYYLSASISGAFYNLMLLWINTEFSTPITKLEETMLQFSGTDYIDIISELYMNYFNKVK